MDRLGQRWNLWLLLGLTLAAAIGWAWALEKQFGDGRLVFEEQNVSRGEYGHRTFLLIIDSLAEDDVTHMPTLSQMATTSFSATIQPCVDNFTSACVREALTGRSHFSLFSVLENFQVIRPGVGPNIVDDARQAGLKTAVVSTGDLRGWTKRVDSDIRIHKKNELTKTLETARTHDFVIHHWIWHDVTSHHSHMGTKKYQKSLARTDAFVRDLAEGLPPDTDLIITGDHGHSPDGRHLQGLDAPTFLVANTPNLKVTRPAERVPVRGVRFVLGAALGLPSPNMEAEPRYRDWLNTAAQEHFEEVGLGASAPASPQTSGGSGMPWLAAGLLAVVSLGAFGWRWGLLLVAWVLALGLLFPEWIAHTQQRRSIDLTHWTWLLPVLGVAWGLASKRGVLLGAGVGAAVLLVGLWPGMADYGVIRNSGPLLLSCMVGLALLPAWRAFKQRDVRAALWSASLVGLGLVSLWVAGFNTNFFRIRKLPPAWVDPNSVWAVVVVAILAGIIHALVDSDRRFMPLAMAAPAIGAALGTWPQALVFVAVVVGLAWPVRKVNSRWLVVLLLLFAGHVIPSTRLVGVLLLATTVGSAVVLVPRERAARWLLAVLLLVTGLVSLAWTAKLSVGGINFNFAVAWLEGRWFKRLWFVVALATAIKCLLPLLLVVETARVRVPNLVGEALELASRLAVLRFLGTGIFVVGWVSRMGDAAPSSRLRLIFVDALVWLVLAVVLALLWVRCQSAKAKTTAPGLAPETSGRGAI